MGRISIGSIAIFSFLALFNTNALAQCSKDIECKGNRVCRDGNCVDPNQKAAPAPEPEAAPAPEPEVTPAPAPEAAPAREPQTSAPAKSDSCAKVSCSGHGTCVVKEGGPVCACDEGFQPDQTTGLSCLPHALPTAPGQGQTGGPPSPGWALGGAIIGFVSIGVVSGLGGASAATNEDEIPSIPLGATATTIVAAMAPVTFAGGKSARRSGVRGSIGLRVAGWITYGFCLANAIALIGLGAASDIDVPAWPIITTTLLGDISLGMFAIDALVARKQALEKIESTGARSTHRSADFGLVLSPVQGRDGTSGGVLGFGGRF